MTNLHIVDKRVSMNPGLASTAIQSLLLHLFNIDTISSLFFHIFLASPDALEVILSLTYLLTESVSVSTDLTDVTLVSDDTY